MNNGTVKFYDGRERFGFFAPGDGGKDVFVHVSTLVRADLSSLAEGQKLRFALGQDAKRRNSATNL